MSVFRELGLLADALVEEIHGAKDYLIGVDGKDGVGKSILARELSGMLSAKVIELDNFINKFQDKYVSALRTEELQEVIDQASGIVIIEGVCLLAIMKRLGVKLDTLIYIKRTHHQLWVDEDICLIDCSVEETIKKQEADLFIFSELEATYKGTPLPSRAEMKLSGLTEEIIRYHGTYAPVENAQFIYETEHVERV